VSESIAEPTSRRPARWVGRKASLRTPRIQEGMVVSPLKTFMPEKIEGKRSQRKTLASNPKEAISYS
jgi:hypothetical protein